MSITLPLYQSHKQVRAAEIVSVDTSMRRIQVSSYHPDEPTGSRSQTIMVEDSWLEKFSPTPGMWLVEYADGYRSVSPAKQWLAGYELIDEDDANDEWKAIAAGDQPAETPEPQAKPSPTSGVSNDDTANA